MSNGVGVGAMVGLASVAAVAAVIALVVGAGTAAAVLAGTAIAALGACVYALARAMGGADEGRAPPTPQSELDARVHRILELSHDAHIAIDGSGQVTEWSSAAETMFGWRRDEARGRLLSELIIPEELRQAHQDGLERFLETGQGPLVGPRNELIGIHRDGSEIPLEVSVTAVEEAGEVVFHGLVRDLTERKLLLAAQRAEHRAGGGASGTGDQLTGLPDKRTWDAELDRELARSRRAAGPLCVAVLDLDRFHRYNEVNGRRSGDRLLRRAGFSWRLAVRTSDLICRSGGQEFAVLLPDCPLDEATAVIERVRRTTPEAQTVSAGIAEWNRFEGAEALLGRAEFALYRAKRDGGDRIVMAA